MNETSLTETSPSGIRFRPWEGFALWFLAFVAAGFIYQAIGSEKCSEGVACDLKQVASYMLLSGLFLSGAALWMRFVHRTGLAALGLGKPTWSLVWIGIGYGLAGRFFATITQAATFRIVEAVRGRPPKTPEQIDLPATPSVYFWIGVAIAVVALAPIAEEILFRGLAYLGLRGTGGPLTAILITSIFFAVTHIDPLLMPPLFVLAIMLARLRESRDSLVPCIVAHAAFNLIGFVALYIQHVT